MLELFPQHYPTIKDADVEEYSKHLASDPSIDVVWQIPTGVRDGFRQVGSFDVKRYQDQIVHEKSILGAYVSRLPKHKFDAFKSQHVLSSLNMMSYQKELEDYPLLQSDVLSFEEVQQFIMDYGIDVIILEKEDVHVLQFFRAMKRHQQMELKFREQVYQNHILIYTN